MSAGYYPIDIAQVSQSLSDFYEVIFFDRILVELFPSESNKIKISSYRGSEVEIVRNNAALKIRMPKKTVESPTNQCESLF